MNRAPRKYSQNSGAVTVSQLLAPFTRKAPTNGSDQRGAAAHGGPDGDLDRVGRAHLAGVDDADLRHIERARHAAHHGRNGPDRELVADRRIAGEHDPRLGVADRLQHPAELAGHQPARGQEERPAARRR